MNILVGIHYRTRLFVLFLLVMLAVLGSSMLERHLLHRLGTSVSSLYQDRLLPAMGLYELNDLLYTRQSELENYLATAPSARLAATPARLLIYRQQLDALVQQHRETYLVAEEKQALGAFQKQLDRFNAFEGQLVAAAGPLTATQATEVARQFRQLHNSLGQLKRIQQRVGQQLLLRARATEGNAELLSNIKIALLLFFTLAIQHALLTARHPLASKKLPDFRMN
ncbi:MCP four helix bundle domain-containing protein [Hymenobacter sp. ISL-91]|uniref:MCP four helix bundle domain-containing protein n=1 Tax=Hymenobacter sp. ISL-91 TaxID=2819151 RepID=UPI001C1B8CD7|nr:MCP four helix bundle domain-containing protein [Hymenobacter sp. ISL-91]MBT2557868.1 MCP four helix bundle domain-containing protein [Hymenobacter sp. ISL-91]